MKHQSSTQQTRGWRCAIGRRLVIFAVFAIFLFGVAVANAAEIHLKDGRYIEVERCWEKGSEVVFKLKDSGRLFSVNKELVEKITGNKGHEPDKEAAH